MILLETNRRRRRTDRMCSAAGGPALAFLTVKPYTPGRNNDGCVIGSGRHRLGVDIPAPPPAQAAPAPWAMRWTAAAATGW
jgi:hypothetical protein